MSLSCQQAREAVSPYIDGMLSETEAKDLCSHLKTCEACRREYETLSGIQRALADMPQLEVTERFRSELHEKLVAVAKEKAKPQSAKRPIWRMVSGMAAAAAVIAVSVIALNSVPNQADLTPVTMTPEPTGQATENSTDIQDTTENIKAGDNEAADSMQTMKPNSDGRAAQTKKETQQRAAEVQPEQQAQGATSTENAAEDMQTTLPKEATAAPLEEIAETAAYDEEIAVYNTDVNLSDEPSLAAQDTAAPRKSSGGSGGGSSAAGRAAIEPSASRQGVWHYIFTAEGYAEAAGILQNYQNGDGMYCVPKSEAEHIHSELTELSGYCRRRFDAQPEEAPQSGVMIQLDRE